MEKTVPLNEREIEKEIEDLASDLKAVVFVGPDPAERIAACMAILTRTNILVAKILFFYYSVKKNKKRG